MWCLTVQCWCNAWQFHVTYKMADREGIWHWGWGTSVCVTFLADSIHSTLCNAKGSVCKGDILTWLESRQDARRLKWYACVGMMDGGPSVLISIPFCFNGWGIPDVAVQQMSDPPSDPHSRSHLWNLDPARTILQWGQLIRASFCGRLAALLVMVLDGFRGDRGTAKVLLAHQA